MRIKGSDLRKIIKEEISRSLLRETSEVMVFPDEYIEIPEEPPEKLQAISKEEARDILAKGPDAFDELLKSLPATSRGKISNRIRQISTHEMPEISAGLSMAISDYILFGPGERAHEEGRKNWIKLIHQLDF